MRVPLTGVLTYYTYKFIPEKFNTQIPLPNPLYPMYNVHPKSTWLWQCIYDAWDTEELVYDGAGCVAVLDCNRFRLENSPKELYFKWCKYDFNYF